MSALSALRIGELLGVAEPLKEAEAKGTTEKTEEKPAEVIDFKKEPCSEDEKVPTFTVIKEKAEKAKDKAKEVKDKVTKKVEDKKDKDKDAKGEVLPGVKFPTSGLELEDGDFDPVDDDAVSEDDALTDLMTAVKAIDEEDDAANVIREAKEDEDMAVVNMKSKEFYDKVGNVIYDVDRGMEMDGELRSWIIAQFAKDKELATEVIKTLPSIVGSNPKFIPDLKKIIRDAAEANIPYTITYISKADDKEYESRAAAEASVKEACEKFGLKFSQVIKKVYRRVDKNGKLGAKVKIDEVENFVANFDGDKEALREKLQLPDKSKKSDKSDKDDSKED